jgi:hypothetical protein
MKIEQAIEKIKMSAPFTQKLQTLEVVNGELNGSFFGILDDEFLAEIAKDVHRYTATCIVQYHGQGMEGGISRTLRIVDESGHGFETTV